MRTFSQKVAKEVLHRCFSENEKVTFRCKNTNFVTRFLEKHARVCFDKVASIFSADGDSLSHN